MACEFHQGPTRECLAIKGASAFAARCTLDRSVLSDHLGPAAHYVDIFCGTVGWVR